MNPFAVGLLIYIWHYLVARTIYDLLIRPLAHGAVSALTLAVGAAAVGFVLGRVTRRRA